MRIDLHIGGLFGPTMRVRGDQSRLVYEHTGRDGQTLNIVLEPSPADWERFNVTLEAIGAWEWHGTYSSPPGTADGTSWSITLEDRQRHHRSRGSNAYPPAFDRFCDAVEALIDHPFR